MYFPYVLKINIQQYKRIYFLGAYGKSCISRGFFQQLPMSHVQADAWRWIDRPMAEKYVTWRGSIFDTKCYDKDH